MSLSFFIAKTSIYLFFLFSFSDLLVLSKTNLKYLEYKEVLSHFLSNADFEFKISDSFRGCT
jgi:hypothetical protein